MTIPFLQKLKLGYCNAFIYGVLILFYLNPIISQVPTERSVVTIPVVVHIIYNKPEENITDAQVQSQIDVLNRDYRRRNTDTSQTPSVWKPVAADCEIEFCLARRDPAGNSTTGITRRRTTVLVFNSISDVKNSLRGGVNNWNPERYLNIWVANIGNAVGFATFPTELATKPKEDGVVIHTQYFGTMGTVTPPFHLGRTATHEVGHWLNLHHPWGSDSAKTCATKTDSVADTPPQKLPVSGCPVFPQRDECSPSGSGFMFMNFMNYTDDACMNLFTQGQKQRITEAIKTYRSGLLTTEGCLMVSTNDTPTLHFDIFPTPSVDGHFFLKNIPPDAQLVVHNYLGQVILNKKINADFESVDLSAAPNGIYFFTLTKNKIQGFKKVVKL